MAYVEEAQHGAGQRAGDGEEGQEPEIEDHLQSCGRSHCLNMVTKRVSERTNKTDKRPHVPSRRWSRWRWPLGWAERRRCSRPRPRCRGRRLATTPPRRTVTRKPTTRRPPRALPVAGAARSAAGALAPPRARRSRSEREPSRRGRPAGGR